jgi:hypothetical protein
LEVGAGADVEVEVEVAPLVAVEDVTRVVTDELTVWTTEGSGDGSATVWSTEELVSAAELAGLFVVGTGTIVES